MLIMLYGIFFALTIMLFSPNIKKNFKDKTASQLWVFWLFSIFFIAVAIWGIEISLFGFMLLTSVFYFYDKFKLNHKSKLGEKGLMFHLVDFFPILLIIWIIRSFLFQPYQVPTGSLEPTVRPGDFLLVNQYEYGLRMPIWRTMLFNVNKPKRGDIVVFFPPGKEVHFVKRLIGLPGDIIRYDNKTLFVNGKTYNQTVLGPGFAQDPGAPVIEKSENMDGIKHSIFINPMSQYETSKTWVVPKNHYFFMGDNRDFSGDSREFGFVPEKDIVGQPKFVWLSVDMNALRNHDWMKFIRWGRIGKKVV